MADATFFQFLSAALGALEAEVPGAYRRVEQALAGTELALCVDGESRVVRLTRAGHSLSPGTEAPLRLRTRRAVLTDLATAARSLREAVVSDDLAVSGSPDDVLGLLSAIDAFVRGAVRSRTLPALFGEYLESSPHDDDPSQEPANDRATTEGVRDGLEEAQRSF